MVRPVAKPRAIGLVLVIGLTACGNPEPLAAGSGTDAVSVADTVSVSDSDTVSVADSDAVSTSVHADSMDVGSTPSPVDADMVSVADTVFAADTVSVADTGPAPLQWPSWTDDPCADLAKLKSGSYGGVVKRWTAQDDKAPRHPGQVVFVGSSSIRLWERLYEEYAAYGPIQRGFGGSRIWDAAEHADALITRHKPAAVVIYAGTNDLAAKHTPGQTIDGFRCLVKRIAAKSPPIPVAFITITPTPARWSQWPQAKAVHAGVHALAKAHNTIHVIDASQAFLNTGSPPTSQLFVADKLHLNVAGYALWSAVIGPALKKLSFEVSPPKSQKHAAGRRWLIDFGPSNAEDGAPTKSPTSDGVHWNSWHDIDGGAGLLPGESLGALVDTKGGHSSVRVVVSSRVIPNGIVNGGLTKPKPSLLGDLAVHTATQDYFYVEKGGIGGLSIGGLDPSRTYRLRLFGSRNATEKRVTRYRLSGGGPTQDALLQTSGKNASGKAIGANGWHGNDAKFATFDAAKPDKWGNLHVDFAATEGQYAYLGIIDLRSNP